MTNIALRAISPGINDPNTAKECINVIGLVLGEISIYTGDKIMVKDDHDIPRLFMEGIEFKELLYFTFYQLRHYGNEDISIILSIINALTTIAHKALKQSKIVTWDFHRYILEEYDEKKIKKLDKLNLDRQLSIIEKVCNSE